MPARRRTLWIIGLILATVLLVILLSVAPFNRVNFWAVDLGSYRAAALALRNGADPFLQENLVQYADGAPISALTRYTYLPTFLLFILPLTWVPLHLAVRVWLILNLCMLSASVVLLSKALAWDLTAGQFFVSMLGAAAFVPVLHCLAVGQASIWILFWLAAAFYLIKRGRDVPAGVCLALCFSKLQVLALVPFVFLLQKRWRLVGSWALAFVISIVPFWRLLPSLWESILWTTEANMASLGYYCQPCLSALAKVLFTPGLPATLFAGLATLGTLVVVVRIGASRGKDREQPDFDRVFALAIAASLLTAGYVRTHDLVLLLVPLAILLNDARRAGASLVSKRTSRVSAANARAPVPGAVFPDGKAALSSLTVYRVQCCSVSIAYLFPYALLALSPLVPVLRFEVFHITSTLSVMIGLLVLAHPAFSTGHLSDGIMARESSIAHRLCSISHPNDSLTPNDRGGN